jgi:predicted metal-dependent enzyme (double-stranded beta helix superfamily)
MIAEVKPVSKTLMDFVSEMRSIRQEFLQPADIVYEGAPVMHRLMEHVDEILCDDHTKPCGDHYARNLVYAEPDDTMSLFCIVWQPGQFTPVHDHGAWGMVGVVRGALHEHNFIRVDDQERENNGIVLRRGGTSVLAPGSVTTFVPNPDHIHRAGVPRNAEQTVTLHLYGRNMDRYNVYDMELGRRTPIDVTADNQADHQQI